MGNWTAKHPGWRGICSTAASAPAIALPSARPTAWISSLPGLGPCMPAARRFRSRSCRRLTKSRSRLQHAGCKALLTDAERSAVAHASKARAGTSSEVLLIEDAIANASGEAPPCDASPNSFAMLLYTSGTTGAAKGVCITHGSLGAHTQALVEQTLRLTEDDRILGTLPLTHSYGIRMTLLAPFLRGCKHGVRSEVLVGAHTRALHHPSYYLAFRACPRCSLPGQTRTLNRRRPPFDGA